jgi:hypothetical protein
MIVAATPILSKTGSVVSASPSYFWTVVFQIPKARENNLKLVAYGFSLGPAVLVKGCDWSSKTSPFDWREYSIAP